MKRVLILALMIFAACAASRAQGSTVYPDDIDDGVTLPVAVDKKFTFLTAAVTNSATVIPVNSTAGLPSTTVAEVDSELMSCAVTDATTLTCSRAFSGTFAAPHAIRATVRFPLVSAHVNGARGAVVELEKKLGTGASAASAAATGHQLTKQADGTTAWAAAGGGSGTVTSVALSAPSAVFDVAGSPVTTSGTLALTFDNQAASTVFAGPSSGPDAAPAFRALVEADIPVLSAAKIGAHAHAASDVTSGTLATARLGSGAASSSTFLRGDQTWAAPPVVSVFGRTGAVVAQANDYTWAQVDKTTSGLADLATRSASDLTSGTLPDARFPATLPAVSGANLTALNASSLSSGTVATARLGSGTANSSTYLRGDQTWATPVISITGTANQVTASASTGAVTLSLPQSIATTSAPTFADLTLSDSQPDLTLNYTNTANYSRVLFNEAGVGKAAFQYIGSTFATTGRRNAMEFFNNATGDVVFFAGPVVGSATEQLRVNAAGGATVTGALTATTISLGGGITWTKTAGAPAGACTSGALHTNTTTGKLSVCESAAWVTK